MTIASLHEVAVFDDEGSIEGLQFDGRERSIQEWRDRREEEEYQELFQRLHSRNWARRSRDTPEGRVREQENLRRYREANRERIREMEQSRRRAKYEAAPVVNVCNECGTVWSPPYERRVKRSKFCSKRCRNRANGRKRQRPTMGLRQMDIQKLAMQFIRDNPRSTAKQIALAIGAKPKSLRVCLKRWVDDGAIVRRGRRNIQYAISRRGDTE